jgi:hypothetical protein
VPFRRLGAFADRLAEPALTRIKEHVHAVLLAAAVLALGIAFLITGLGYLASSLWHALVPAIGTVGADLLLGGVYITVAVSLFLGGSRLTK